MIIKKITLEQFRNYSHLSIRTGPGINVFYGENAQGKTNILEAVYLCACARSHRTARDIDLIRQTHDQYRVLIEFISQNGSDESIELIYRDAVAGDPQRSRPVRQVIHNGVKLDRISDLMGLFHAVIFAPEDLMLVKEGPSTRRRYLDLLISQVRPTYFVKLQQFAKIMAQRNRLLKNLREQTRGRHSSPDTASQMQIEVWNQALAHEAAGLIQQRQIYVERIAELAGKAQEQISSGKEKLFVKYRGISGLTSNMSEKEIFEIYLEKLNHMVNEDIERGSTGAGPHRDDIELSLDGTGLKPFASQGQQRSAVLALKLAELAILQQDTGEQPVFLLDDVMSELDEYRRNSLIRHIHNAQVLVTCTEPRQVASELQAVCEIAGLEQINPEQINDEQAEGLPVDQDLSLARPITQDMCFFKVEQGTVVEVSFKSL